VGTTTVESGKRAEEEESVSVVSVSTRVGGW
jgi:hypothetical protein